MTREEAIEEIKQVRFNLNCQLNGTSRFEEAFEMAIKALERTEPQEVLYSGDGYYDGELVYDFAECPECGYEYEEGDKDWGLPFCPNCGQALKWEVENDE